MSFSGESSDSECPPYDKSSDSRKATKIKTEEIIKSEKKYYQQRFVEKWLDRFKPWLARDNLDPNKPFCQACNCRLNCNKCHLQRHEKTTKHHSNLEAFMSANGMVAFKQNIGQKKERRKVIKASPETEADDKFESVFMDIDFESGKRVKVDENLPQESMHDFQFIHGENSAEIQQTSGVADDSTPSLYEMNVVNSTPRKTEKKSSESRSANGHRDRKKLLLQIQKDKNELMTSFNELFSSTSSAAEKKEKNHVDLFFDSVSSSVKALTPKLIAEAKMRVSQLVCELELRAITESEAMNASAGASSSTVLLAVPPGNAYIINQNQVGSSQNDHAYEATG